MSGLYLLFYKLVVNLVLSLRRLNFFTPLGWSLSHYLRLMKNLFIIFLCAFVYIIYMFASVVCFYLIRHQISGNKTNGVLDAFYFTFILSTSVGFGDLIPNTTLSLLLATLFAILGMLLIGTMYGVLAEVVLALRSDEESKWAKMFFRKRLVYLPAFFLVVHMAVGIPVMASIENLDFIHAFYCINATLISVGSDNCFSTIGGRIFALAWITEGMFITTFVLLAFTESYTQRRQTSLVKMALEGKTTPQDLEAADLDGDGVLVLAEYIVYMLNKMEKLRRQDIEPIIQEYYQRLDFITTELLTSNGAQTSTVESDGGNQASSSEPRRPSYRTIPIPSSLDQKRKFGDYFNKSDLLKIIIILSIYLVAGTTCFYLARHHISGTKTNSILDALFFMLVITTSVGYGDLSPNDTLAMLLSSLFSLLGMFFLALVLSLGAYALVKQQLPKIGPAKLQKRKEPNKVRNKIIVIVILFLVHMAVGTAILVSVEDLDLIHAFYCISVTITSAGSHKCFSTKRGRVLALFWILLGTIYKGYVLFTFTELYTQYQRAHEHFVENLTTTTTRADLEAADLDGDGVVGLAEYILLKLRKKEKFHESDVVVARIIAKFQRDYDVDKTRRKLSLRDKLMP